MEVGLGGAWSFHDNLFHIHGRALRILNFYQLLSFLKCSFIYHNWYSLKLGHSIFQMVPYQTGFLFYSLPFIHLPISVHQEISEVRNNEKKHNNWRQWRTRHMEKDMDYCHPRWPEEDQYLSSELLQIRGYQRTYFRDPWNIFEWVSFPYISHYLLELVA